MIVHPTLSRIDHFSLSTYARESIVPRSLALGTMSEPPQNHNIPSAQMTDGAPYDNRGTLLLFGELHEGILERNLHADLVALKAQLRMD